MPPLTRATALHPFRPVLGSRILRRSYFFPPASYYNSTLDNLKINETTRIIYQGFTGKAATVNALQNIQYGTKVVGGVTPGKNGRHLGLPLYQSVAEAARELKPDATAIFVAAPYAAAAIEEAIEAEIPLIVAVAEHVPLHDMLRVHSALLTQRASRLVGANCPGILNPRAHCRIGFMPYPSFLPGSIGIVAKSGTLSYEAVASTTRVGLGQSLVVGMGGDALAGTSLVDAVRVFLDDPGTEGIAVIGEIGGDAEIEVADVVERYRMGGGRKPVMALVAGVCAIKGRVMGHAGAYRGAMDPSIPEKVRALEDAGVVMVQHPGQFGAGFLKLFGRPMPLEPVKGMGPNGPAQQRGLHTMARRRPISITTPGQIQQQQRRSLYTEDPAVVQKILEHSELKFPISQSLATTPTFGLGMTIDRQARCPAYTYAGHGSKTITTVPYNHTNGCDLNSYLFLELNLPRVAENRPLSTWYDNYSYSNFEPLIDNISAIFSRLNAYTIFFRQISPEYGIHLPGGVLMHLDHTSPPQIEIAPTLRKEELAAAKHGIVYHTLPGEGRIGTLVNGAGLAMNTVDYLTLCGGSVANFLDTGGKATGRTVVEGLRIVLADERVKAVFVNIFGGLTDCTMIAEGILMAYKELEMGALGVPLVVRLRGTNEEIGQALMKDSGLPVLAYDDLDEAVDKVIELSGEK